MCLVVLVVVHACWLVFGCFGMFRLWVLSKIDCPRGAACGAAAGQSPVVLKISLSLFNSSDYVFSACRLGFFKLTMCLICSIMH